MCRRAIGKGGCQTLAMSEIGRDSGPFYVRERQEDLTPSKRRRLSENDNFYGCIVYRWGEPVFQKFKCFSKGDCQLTDEDLANVNNLCTRLSIHKVKGMNVSLFARIQSGKPIRMNIVTRVA